MLPRVHRIKKPNGDVHKYHRHTRAPLPTHIPEDHPAFMRAWLAEEEKAPKRSARPSRGTVAHACEEYLTSASFRALRTGYSRVILGHVNRIAAQGKAALLSELLPRHIRADLEPLTPAVASSRLKAWRKLAEFWAAKGMTATNLCDGIKRKRLIRSEGHKEWTADDLARFREFWPIGTAERLAAELLQWTGARCVDAVRLGPQMVGRDGVLSFTQAKTGQPAFVPWTCEAHGLDHQRADLAACLAPSRDLVWLITAQGKARSVKGLSQWFSAAATRAGLPDLTAHGLRKYRMNQLAEHGLPVLVQQAWCGHVTLQEVEDYTRRANRRKIVSGTQVVNRLPSKA